MYRKLIIATLVLPAALFCGAGCHSSSSQPAATSPTATPSNAPPASATANTSTTPVATQPAPAPGNVSSMAPAARPVAEAAKPAPPRLVDIPRGTVLHVRTVQAVGSKLSEDGQSFDGTLDAPVVVHGHTVIPSGAPVSGTVTQAHAAGRFKGGATLALDLNRIRINGDSYPVHTALFQETGKGKGKRTAEFIGGGGAGGALIGGLAGGGKGALIGGLLGAGAGTAGAAVTGNRDITLPSESRLNFRLTEPLSIPAR